MLSVGTVLRIVPESTLKINRLLKKRRINVERRQKHDYLDCRIKCLSPWLADAAGSFHYFNNQTQDQVSETDVE